MCNAHNHGKDCRCGFGGDGHLGRRVSSSFDIYPFSYVPVQVSDIVFDKKKENSYTIPNARCPICGEKVFFFRSENGGCAYFDELGPPWPKHPCVNDSQFVLLVQEDINDYLPPIIKYPFTTWLSSNIYYSEDVTSHLPDEVLVTFRNVRSQNELSMILNVDAGVLTNGIFSIVPIEGQRYSLEGIYITAQHEVQNISLVCDTRNNGLHMRLGEVCRKSNISMIHLLSVLKEDFNYDPPRLKPSSKIPKAIGIKIIEKYKRKN